VAVREAVCGAGRCGLIPCGSPYTVEYTLSITAFRWHVDTGCVLLISMLDLAGDFSRILEQIGQYITRLSDGQRFRVDLQIVNNLSGNPPLGYGDAVVFAKVTDAFHVGDRFLDAWGNLYRLDESYPPTFESISINRVFQHMGLRHFKEIPLQCTSAFQDPEGIQGLKIETVHSLTPFNFHLDIGCNLEFYGALCQPCLTRFNDTPLDPPDSLRTYVSGGTVTLYWNVPRGDLDGFEVHRSTTSGFTPSDQTRVARTGPTSESLTQSLPAGTYYFRVVAIGPQGKHSQPSSEAQATVA